MANRIAELEALSRAQRQEVAKIQQRLQETEALVELRSKFVDQARRTPYLGPHFVVETIKRRNKAKREATALRKLLAKRQVAFGRTEREIRRQYKMPSIANSLKKAAHARDLSVNQLAKEAGIAQSTLQRFLAGKQQLTLPNVEKLAAVLGLGLRAT